MSAPKSPLNLLVHINLLAYETKESRQPKERDSNTGTFEHIVERALLTEESGFDGVFFGDCPSLIRETLQDRGPFPFEPFTLLSALAARTKRLGLIGTVQTTFNDPYNLARRFAALDQLSGGRAAWNAVTGFIGGADFGLDPLPSPEARYEQAEEFLDVVLKLWNSWEPGYLDTDPTSDRYIDAEKVQDIGHHGRFYDVEGALSVPPSPQGHPIVVQAGASAPGIELGGRFGELIYVAAPTIEHGLEQAEAYRSAAAAAGRADGSLKVAPGLFAYIGETREAAEASRSRIFTDKQLLRGLGTISIEYDGFKLDHLALDDVLDPAELPTKEEILASGHRRSRALLYLEFAQKPGTTLRSFLTDVLSGTGHTTVTGSYDEVAAELERWHRAGAADGFVLMGTNSLQEFLDEVVPRLERKGVFARRPELTTFRDRLGLGAAVQAVAAS